MQIAAFYWCIGVACLTCTTHAVTLDRWAKEEPYKFLMDPKKPLLVLIEPNQTIWFRLELKNLPMKYFELNALLQGKYLLQVDREKSRFEQNAQTMLFCSSFVNENFSSRFAHDMSRGQISLGIQMRAGQDLSAISMDPVRLKVYTAVVANKKLEKKSGVIVLIVILTIFVLICLIATLWILLNENEEGSLSQEIPTNETFQSISYSPIAKDYYGRGCIIGPSKL